MRAKVSNVVPASISLGCNREDTRAPGGREREREIRSALPFGVSKVGRCVAAKVDRCLTLSPTLSPSLSLSFMLPSRSSCCCCRSVRVVLTNIYMKSKMLSTEDFQTVEMKQQRSRHGYRSWYACSASNREEEKLFTVQREQLMHGELLG